ncbi:BnaC04g55450D [Brassica napus]|uniref:BnaC04g55450D protein n=1 Tax=Brassica napus TaxID=3708 RepID=A0A078IQ97_BRANA|nr:BnaC04g55450D [Brassica napus]
MSYLDGQTNEYFSSKSSSAFHSLKVHLTAYTHFRFACIQVLFSAMYHLKSTLLPFAFFFFFFFPFLSSYLLKLASRFLEQGSEKLAGAKLMASLMEILSKALSDPSQNVREVCDELLACITPT